MGHMRQEFRLSLAGSLCLLYGNLQLFILYFQQMIGFSSYMGDHTAKGNEKRQSNTANDQNILRLIQVIPQAVILIRNIHILINDVLFLRLRYQPQCLIHHMKQHSIHILGCRQSGSCLIAEILPFDEVGESLIFRQIIVFYRIQQRNIRPALFQSLQTVLCAVTINYIYIHIQMIHPVSTPIGQAHNRFLIIYDIIMPGYNNRIICHKRIRKHNILILGQPDIVRTHIEIHLAVHEQFLPILAPVNGIKFYGNAASLSHGI